MERELSFKISGQTKTIKVGREVPQEVFENVQSRFREKSINPNYFEFLEKFLSPPANAVWQLLKALKLNSEDQGSLNDLYTGIADVYRKMRLPEFFKNESLSLNEEKAIRQIPKTLEILKMLDHKKFPYAKESISYLKLLHGHLKNAETSPLDELKKDQKNDEGRGVKLKSPVFDNVTKITKTSDPIKLSYKMFCMDLANLFKFYTGKPRFLLCIEICNLLVANGEFLMDENELKKAFDSIASHPNSK